MTRRRTTSYQLAEVALRMRQAPGKWHTIPTHSGRASDVVTRQRKGDMPAFPPGMFETKSAGGVVYGRFTG